MDADESVVPAAVPVGSQPLDRDTSTAIQPSTVTRTDFHWEHTGAPWHVLAYLALAALLAWWGWRRYGLAPLGLAGRIARLCRVAALVLLVAMIAGPAWRTSATTVVPGRVLIAVDRSASMTRTDTPDRRPRLAVAGDLAGELGAVAAARHLALDWQSVGGLAGAIDPALLARGEVAATGATSPLSEELLRLIDGARYDLVLLVSDGRVTAGAGLEAAASALRAKDVPVLALASGGDAIEPGLWIDGLVVNESAALNEGEPVLVRLGGRALGDAPVTVRLLVDGKLLATKEVSAAGGEPADPAATRAFEAALEAEYAKEGTAVLRVEAEQGALKDARELRIEVAERKLQVLILDSRPRYELRYLREALRRDHTIEVHAYLSEGKRWRRWSEKGPSDHLPLSAGEARDYDVILLGDLGPDAFSDEQQLAIDGAVRKHASGLVWMLGETGATAGFTKTKLGALLPTRLPPAETIARGYLDNQPRRLSRTPGAEARRLFESGAVPWDRLPELLGGAPAGEPLPGAEPLMQDQDGQPVVIARDYPPGRAVLIAVDDTWRWRRNVGDAYLQRFHGQLLRYAAAGRRHSAKTWRLVAQPRRAVPGEVVTLNLAPIGPPPENGPERAVATLTAADGTQQVVTLTAVPGGAGFTARLPAPAVGSWRLAAIDGPNPREIEESELEVFPPASEVRDPRADRPALDALARGTGGRVFTDAKALVAALPDVRKDRIETLPPRGLWDNAWALAAVVALLAIEWGLRRVNRLP